MLGFVSLVVFSLCTLTFAQNDARPVLPGISGPVPRSLEEAESYIQSGKFVEAEVELRLFLRQETNSGRARYLLAYALMRQGKAREAIAEYNQAAALRKPSADELRGVSQAYMLIGDYADADKWLMLSLHMEPANADSWYNLGRLRYTQGQYPDALACFQKVLALVPRSVKAENNLGLAYEGLNLTHEAEMAYRQALAWQDAGPASAASEQPLLNLGILLSHGSDPSEAKPLLLRAAAIAPLDPRIHEQLGQVALRESRFEEAAHELGRAVELDPGRSNLHFLLGQAYKRLGKHQEATDEFTKAARLSHASQ